MSNIKKILCPVDFSEASTAAMRTAETLAHATGADLILLHVVNEPAFDIPEAGYAGPRIIEEYEQAMKAKLAELVGSVRQDVSVSSKTVRGAPHLAIVAAAEAEHADFLVMGTHGRTGLSHLFLGSVAERVVRLSRVPVMTVRAQ